MHSGQHDDKEQPATGGMDGTGATEEQPISTARPRRSAYKNGISQKSRGRQHIEGYNSVDDMEGESDATSSGGEWEGGDDDDVDDNIVDGEDDADVDMSDDDASIAEDEEDGEGYGRRRSLVVSLRYQKTHAPSVDSAIHTGEGPPDDISAAKPASLLGHDSYESKSYAAVHTGSPAPPITNIHAAVTETSANPLSQTGPILNGNSLDHKTFAQPNQDNPPTVS